MANGSLAIAVKLTADGKGFKILCNDAESFKTVLSATTEQVQSLNARMINSAAAVTAFQGLSSAVSQLQGVFSNLTQAYQTQLQVERQLEQSMNNTMNAIAEEVQRIKDLCSAQQELGVIGDEVQLAGAQKLATFLQETESLEKLIPAMNDYVAAQRGYSASATDMESAAMLIGKAMTGQVGALRRAGIVMNEAQTQIMKTGSESERAAVLYDLLSSKFGGQNAALAQGAVGYWAQLQNTLGDYCETMGSAVMSFMPFINGLAATTMAISGTGQLIASLKACSAVTAVFNRQMLAAKAAAISTALGLDRGVKQLRLFRLALMSATTSARAFKIALRGIGTATVVGGVLVALGYAIEQLINLWEEGTERSRRFTEELNRQTRAAKLLQEAMNTGADARARAIVEMDEYVRRIQNFQGTQAQEARLVDELNDKYGEQMGYFATLAQWQQALTNNSRAYSRQLEIQAIKEEIVAQNIREMAALRQIQTRTALDEDGNARPDSYYTRTRRSFSDGLRILGEARNAGLSDIGVVQGGVRYISPAEVNSIRHHRKLLDNQRLERELTEELNRLTLPTYGSQTRPGHTPTTPTTPEPTAAEPTVTAAPEEQSGPQLREGAETLAEIEENIRYYREQLQKATADTAPAILEQIAYWQKLADAIRTMPQPELIANPQTLRELEQNIAILQEQLKDANLEEAAAINDTIKAYQDKAAAIREATNEINKQEEKTKDNATADSIAAGAASGLGQALSSVAEITNEGTGAWLKYASNLLGTVGPMIQAVMALGLAKSAETSQNVPFPLNIVALATSMAAFTAAMLQIPKFAEGGIAYGPTLGLFGEYAGAANNPEVVAPLSDLRSMLEPRDIFAGGGYIEVRMRGDQMIGQLRRQNLINSRR